VVVIHLNKTIIVIVGVFGNRIIGSIVRGFNLKTVTEIVCVACDPITTTLAEVVGELC